MQPTGPTPVGARVVDLHKRYGEVRALRGLSFELGPGEIFGLLGPNGAGKTTTLECLLGLRTPDRGAITIAGLDALRQPRGVRLLVGAQLQDAALQDKITPREALALFGSFHAAPADPDTLLDRFGLAGKATAAFDSLSSGQRRRLFLALAFVNRPRLIVLDEPTAGLDPRGRRELQDLIRSLRADGCTILLSTHDLAEAEALCDRVAILHEGRSIAEASPSELVRASGSGGRIRFVATRPPPPAALQSLPGVISCESLGAVRLLRTRDAHASVIALAGLLQSSGSRLEELEVERPSLEDVFIDLTGRAWPGDAPEEKRP